MTRTAFVISCADLTFQRRASNIITVSGRNEAVLNGRELLAALQRYDHNARHDD
jgi:hypothetical protein